MNPVRPWCNTYVLLSEKTGKFYTGATSNFKNRIEKHEKGLVASTRPRRRFNGMKKFFVLIVLVIGLFSSGFIYADMSCSNEIGKLPILSHGRVKPLSVHAKETLKFITGKSNPGKTTSIQTYCDLSVAEIIKKEKAHDLLGIKVSHVGAKRFFELSDSAKSVAPSKVLESRASLERYIYNLENTSKDKALINDLKAIIQRTRAYYELVRGLDWKIPIPSKQYEDSAKLGKYEWTPLLSFVLSYKLNKKSKTDIIQAAQKAGNGYTQTDDHHLTEWKYDHLKLFHWAILVSLLSLILAFVLKKTFHPLTMISVCLVLAMEVAASIFRVVISGRAPISNMFETVMWVGIGALIFALILSVLRKEKLFLIFGLIINIICLFMMTFATGMLDSSIRPLAPVLRDNFWLATHVTSITVSYAALAMSWLIANYYLIKVVIRGVEKEEIVKLNKLTYDCLKIGVVLLAAGIILGGIWADYSWGRFWGWDPKETWSLIALLAYITVIHGRYAGWISQKSFMPFVGLAFNTILMAWFGVNYILATGLHSYGFSSGGAAFLGGVVLAQAIIFLLYFLSKIKQGKDCK